MKSRKTNDIKFYQVPGLPGLELVRGMSVIHSFPRHSHRKYCIGIVDQGCRKYVHNGIENYITTGDILFINPDEVHACSAVDNIEYNYRMLCLDSAYFKKLGPNKDCQWSEDPFFFKTKMIANCPLFKKLVYLFSIFGESEPVLKKENILLDTLGELFERQGYIHLIPIGNESQSIKLIREYLETNYAENVTIDNLSRLTGLSPYHLIRVFKEKTGLSPHSFQTQIRIKQAKLKLVQGHSIIDTALEAGFADQSHFTKFFKRMVGVTPGEFVKRKISR